MRIGRADGYVIVPDVLARCVEKDPLETMVGLHGPAARDGDGRQQDARQVKPAGLRGGSVIGVHGQETVVAAEGRGTGRRGAIFPARIPVENDRDAVRDIPGNSVVSVSLVQ